MRDFLPWLGARVMFTLALAFVALVGFVAAVGTNVDWRRVLGMVALAAAFWTAGTICWIIKPKEKMQDA